MKKTILVIFLLVPILGFPAASLGGEHNHGGKHHIKGHHHGHGEKHMGYAHMVLSKAEEINLTDKQLGLIMRVHLQHKKARKELRQKLHKNMSQIHHGLMNPATEDKVIQDAIKTYTDTINKLAESALTERKRVNAILSEEQKKQILSIQEGEAQSKAKDCKEEHQKAPHAAQKSESANVRGQGEQTPQASQSGQGDDAEIPSGPSGQQQQHHPRYGTKHGQEQPTFSELDTDQDDYISREEAQASEALSKHFRQVDRNRDNRIDRDEFGDFKALQLRSFGKGAPPSDYEYGAKRQGAEEEEEEPESGSARGQGEQTPQTSEGSQHEASESSNGTSEQRKQHPRYGTKHGQEQPTFSELDQDQDDYISREEAQASPALTKHFRLIDRNRDDRIDRNEFGTFKALQLRSFGKGAPPADYEYGAKRQGTEEEEEEETEVSARGQGEQSPQASQSNSQHDAAESSSGTSEQRQQHPPSGTKDEQEQPTFSELDTDQDDYISREEAKASEALTEHFRQVDRNRDNRIDRDEFGNFEALQLRSFGKGAPPSDYEYGEGRQQLEEEESETSASSERGQGEQTPQASQSGQGDDAEIPSGPSGQQQHHPRYGTKHGQEQPAFSELDTDQDDYISREEAKASEALTEHFRQVDRNRDNRIDRDEFGDFKALQLRSFGKGAPPSDYEYGAEPQGIEGEPDNAGERGQGEQSPQAPQRDQHGAAESSSSGASEQRQQHPRYGTKHGQEQPTFSELDQDQNDYISREEAQASPALTKHFRLIDRNRDNQIDRSEFGTFKALQLRSFGKGAPPADYEYGKGSNQSEGQQNE